MLGQNSSQFDTVLSPIACSSHSSWLWRKPGGTQGTKAWKWEFFHFSSSFLSQGILAFFNYWKMWLVTGHPKEWMQPEFPEAIHKHRLGQEPCSQDFMVKETEPGANNHHKIFCWWQRVNFGWYLVRDVATSSCNTGPYSLKEKVCYVVLM